MTAKVLSVVFSLGMGGTERTAQNFAVGYSSIGCDSRILFTRLDGPRRLFLQRNGISVYCLDDKADCNEISIWRPDIVHIHSHDIQPGEFSLIHALCHDAKFVETNVFSRPSPWAQHLLISYQLSQWCEWLFSVRSKHKYRSTILPNAVDTDAFCRSSLKRRVNFRSQHGLLDSDLVIGRVGQSFEGKWSPFLVEVFEDIRDKTTNLKLLLVAPPPLILKRARESRYCKDIVCIQRIHGDMALADCYSSIDVFVLIARQGESFGMVLSESLLCETPVVTMATPWADNSQGEVIGNRIGGFVAATKYQVRQLIEILLFDDRARAEIGRMGRQRIIEMFDYRVVSRMSLDLIRSNGYLNTSVRNPFSLYADSIGDANALSRVILKSGKYFGLLEYTLGYSSWIKLLLVRLPAKIISRILPKKLGSCDKIS